MWNQPAICQGLFSIALTGCLALPCAAQFRPKTAPHAKDSAHPKSTQPNAGVTNSNRPITIPGPVNIRPYRIISNPPASQGPAKWSPSIFAQSQLNTQARIGNTMQQFTNSMANSVDSFGVPMQMSTMNPFQSNMMNPMQSNMMNPFQSNMMNPMQSNMMNPFQSNMMNPYQTNMMNPWGMNSMPMNNPWGTNQMQMNNPWGMSQMQTNPMQINNPWGMNQMQMNNPWGQPFAAPGVFGANAYSMQGSPFGGLNIR
jgi:hypothetical protein